MNNRGFFFYYGLSIILLILSCLFIGISKILGGLMFAIVLMGQSIIYFATNIPNRKLLWEKQNNKPYILSHCDGKITDIAVVKRTQMQEILSGLQIKTEDKKTISAEWFIVKINNGLPQGPDRRSPVDGKLTFVNLLGNKEKHADTILAKYPRYKFWYHIGHIPQDKNDTHEFIVIADKSLQSGEGVSEFVPFCHMLNDSAEFLYDKKQGKILQTQPISALYFQSQSMIFFPKDSYDLKVTKGQTLVACETILASYKSNTQEKIGKNKIKKEDSLIESLNQ